MVALKEFLSAANRLLSPEKFSDYCPNGLQVEGRSEVRKVVSGVTASRALIEAAVAEQADVLFVHHGMFWRGEDPCLVGWKRARIELLLRHGISLVAYHLPLDAHPELGNNIQLAQRLGLLVEGPLAPAEPKVVGNMGRLPSPVRADEFAARIAQALGREPLLIGAPERMIERVGWCTGSAHGYLEYAAAAGADAFVTGEPAEPAVHLARELDIAFYAAGHHATERYGAEAAASRLCAELGLQHRFIDIDNPV